MQFNEDIFAHFSSASMQKNPYDKNESPDSNLKTMLFTSYVNKMKLPKILLFTVFNSRQKHREQSWRAHLLHFSHQALRNVLIPIRGIFGTLGASRVLSTWQQSMQIQPLGVNVPS
jgi:hypothetical protein